MAKCMAFFIAALMVVSATAAWAAMDVEMAAYRMATKDICDTGMANGASEVMAARYEQLSRTMDRDSFGFGRGGNFWGPSQPVLLFDYCHQSGDSGT